LSRPNCDTDNFAILKNICTNMRDPTISKDWIFNNFYVFEIPDYGNQSMSKTFVDFVPQCFYDPEHLDAPTTCVKIKSSYIGMIRSYTQKTAYVLIDKSKYTAYPLSTIIIRCVFKNNLENNYSITTTTKNDNNTFSLTITPDSAVYFQNESDFQLYANKNNGTSIPLDTSLCFIKYSINEW
jgi:hypothetical protein